MLQECFYVLKTAVMSPAGPTGLFGAPGGFPLKPPTPPRKPQPPPWAQPRGRDAAGGTSFIVKDDGEPGGRRRLQPARLAPIELATSPKPQEPVSPDAPREVSLRGGSMRGGSQWGAYQRTKSTRSN